MFIFGIKNMQKWDKDKIYDAYSFFDFLNIYDAYSTCFVVAPDIRRSVVTIPGCTPKEKNNLSKNKTPKEKKKD